MGRDDRGTAKYPQALHHDEIGGQHIGVRRTSLSLAPSHLRGGCPADDQEPRAEGDTAQALQGDLAAHAVIDNVYTSATSQLLHVISETANAIVRVILAAQYMIRSLLRDYIQLLSRAPSGDDCGTHELGEMNSCKTDATRSTMDENRLAWLQLTTGDQTVIGGLVIAMYLPVFQMAGAISG